MMENEKEQQITNDTESFEHFRFEVDKGQAPLRLDKYLTNQMANISRSRIQAAAENNTIWVNEVLRKSNYKVKPYDTISIRLSYPPTEFEIIPQKIPLKIVYEDKHLMVIDKQPGLVVHPGVGNFDGTLLNAIAYHLKDTDSFDANNPHVGLVHRIDKDTSGLLLIAKTPEAKTNLSLQFFNKTTQRTYNAVVWGRMKQEKGTVVGALARDPKDRMCFKVFPEGENPNAKHAITHYKLLEQLQYVSLIECQLETGRTHQIRVHMRHIGHTLFNDERYGGHEILVGERTTKYKQYILNCFKLCNRQALHACTLGFVHPATGEEMFFHSPLPTDIQNLIEKWRDYHPNGQVAYSPN